MTTLTALRRRILECPWDDGLRKYYADALEEADTEESVRHADVIRNTPEPRDEWNIGAALCICQTQGEFVGRLIGVGSAVVRLGFVETISLPLADFMRHAGELFASQPITGVRLTDREPGQSQMHIGMVRWYADNPERCRLNSEVPFDVYNKLSGPRPGESTQPYWHTADAAHAALSAAAVTYGRLAAGLPPLAAPVGVATT